MIEQPVPSEAPTKKPRRWLIPAIIASVVLLLCCSITTVAALAGSSGAKSTVATPTAKLVATVNPNAGALAYEAAIGPQANIMQADFQAIQTDCGANNFAACSSDNQKLHDDAASWLAILKPAPPCLKTVDTQIRAALADYEAGSSLVVSGINSTDATQITAGSKELDSGTAAINQATTDLASVHC